MNIKKGEAGYIRSRKLKLLFFVIAGFAVAGAMIYMGYRATGKRLNLLAVLAALWCLPVCRALVNLIVLGPYHSVNESRELEISGASAHLTMLYDLVLTSEARAIPIEALAIYDHTVCGYTVNRRINTQAAAKYIQAMLRQNKLEKVNVKLFAEYKAFLARVEGMDSIAAVEKGTDRRAERGIRKVILEISM